MEASEKQIPLEDGTVRALADRLVIEQLTVSDERAAQLVRERIEAGHEPAEIVVKLIEIGARILGSEATAANVDYVRAELERGVGALTKELGGTLEAGNEVLADRIATAFGADRSDSVQQQIKEIVARANEEQRSALARLFSADDGANPLADFRNAVVRSMAEARESHETQQRAMREELSSVREEMARLSERQEADARVAEAEEAGTRKGRTFEEHVHDAVERIASARGDCAHHTGNTPAEGGGKKGDTLVEISAADGPAQGRIVFEAKDKRGLSKQEAWRELNGSLEKRAADFAVLVVAGEEQVPSKREPLHEYEGNKMIAAVDRSDPDGIELEAAYRLAVARVRMAKSRSLTVDAAGVRDAVEAAVTALKDAQKIRSALTGAGKTIDNVRTALDGMIEAVEQQLERIESLVAVADETD
jgi:hypothetical protein